MHGSDGWDRTTLLCSVSQVLIDPYYRTITGLAILIEKDWLSFGFPFSRRGGIVKDATEEETSPSFILFLDVLHQIVIQFPNLFEFNTTMLNFLAHHVYSGRYGTFLFDSDYTRDIYQARSKTVSIWTDVLGKRRNDFINVFYEASNTERLNPIYPNFAMYKMRLWEEYFLKYYTPPGQEDTITPAVKQIESSHNFYTNTKLESRARIEELEKKKSRLKSLLTELNEKAILKDTLADLSEETKDYFNELSKGLDKI